MLGSASTTVTLAAELGVQGAELEADVAAADHHQALGHLAEGERAGRVDDAVAVELEAGISIGREPVAMTMLLGLDDERLAGVGALALDLDGVARR